MVFLQVSERYLILEYLEGGSIMRVNEHGRAEGPVYDEEAAQNYMTQLVAALDYLHGLNIVHGNIKPENILLTRDRWQQNYFSFRYFFSFSFPNWGPARGAKKFL